MKMPLIQEDSSPWRIRIVLFVVMSTTMGLLFMIIGAVLTVLSIVPEFPSLVVLGAGLLSGAYLSTHGTSIELSERQRRREAAFTLPGEHPRLGAYKYWPHHPHWSATVALIPGADPSVTLSGSATTPSDDDVALWLDHIAPRMGELTEAASLGLKSAGIEETVKLSPRSVKFRDHGEFRISFDSEPVLDSPDSPSAKFSKDLELLEVSW